MGLEEPTDARSVEGLVRAVSSGSRSAEEVLRSLANQPSTSSNSTSGWAGKNGARDRDQRSFTSADDVGRWLLQRVLLTGAALACDGHADREPGPGAAAAPRARDVADSAAEAKIKMLGSRMGNPGRVPDLTGSDFPALGGPRPATAGRPAPRAMEPPSANFPAPAVSSNAAPWQRPSQAAPTPADAQAAARVGALHGAVLASAHVVGLASHVAALVALLAVPEGARCDVGLSLPLGSAAAAHAYACAALLALPSLLAALGPQLWSAIMELPGTRGDLRALLDRLSRAPPSSLAHQAPPHARPPPPPPSMRAPSDLLSHGDPGPLRALAGAQWELSAAFREAASPPPGPGAAGVVPADRAAFVHRCRAAVRAAGSRAGVAALGDAAAGLMWAWAEGTGVREAGLEKARGDAAVASLPGADAQRVRLLHDKMTGAGGRGRGRGWGGAPVKRVVATPAPAGSGAGPGAQVESAAVEAMAAVWSSAHSLPPAAASLLAVVEAADSASFTQAVLAGLANRVAALLWPTGPSTLAGIPPTAPRQLEATAAVWAWMARGWGSCDIPVSLPLGMPGDAARPAASDGSHLDTAADRDWLSHALAPMAGSRAGLLLAACVPRTAANGAGGNNGASRLAAAVLLTSCCAATLASLGGAGASAAMPHPSLEPLLRGLAALWAAPEMLPGSPGFSPGHAAARLAIEDALQRVPGGAGAASAAVERWGAGLRDGWHAVWGGAAGALGGAWSSAWAEVAVARVLRQQRGAVGAGEVGQLWSHGVGSDGGGGERGGRGAGRELHRDEKGNGSDDGGVDGPSLSVAEAVLARVESGDAAPRGVLQRELLERYSVGNGHSLRAVVDAVAATVGPAAAAHAVASAGGDAAVGRARRIHTAAVGLVVKSLAGAVSARLLVGGAHPDAATAPKGEDALRAADAVGAVSVGALLERAAACLGEVQDRLAEQAVGEMEGAWVEQALVHAQSHAPAAVAALSAAPGVPREAAAAAANVATRAAAARAVRALRDQGRSRVFRALGCPDSYAAPSLPRATNAARIRQALVRALSSPAPGAAAPASPSAPSRPRLAPDPVFDASAVLCMARAATDAADAAQQGEQEAEQQAVGMGEQIDAPGSIAVSIRSATSDVRRRLEADMDVAAIDVAASSAGSAEDAAGASAAVSVQSLSRVSSCASAVRSWMQGEEGWTAAMAAGAVRDEERAGGDGEGVAADAVRDMAAEGAMAAAEGAWVRCQALVAALGGTGSVPRLAALVAWAQSRGLVGERR